jgi:hypothetical protein
MTVPQPVASLNVQDYAGLLQVTEAHVTHVRVTERITFADSASPPAVIESVSGGRLSLSDPACANWTCSVSFIVTVPPGVTVTAAGGPMSISGTAGANLDSSGAPVTATDIHGPLTVATHGGTLLINGLTGSLSASTGGGLVVATHITAATADVTTGSGGAQIAFSAAPDSVTVSTAHGPATLAVPGGPYALNANSNGAPQIIDIATSSSASRSITVTTGGGPLRITSQENPGIFPLPQGPNPARAVTVHRSSTRGNGRRFPLSYGWGVAAAHFASSGSPVISFTLPPLLGQRTMLAGTFHVLSTKHCLARAGLLAPGASQQADLHVCAAAAERS